MGGVTENITAPSLGNTEPTTQSSQFSSTFPFSMLACLALFVGDVGSGSGSELGSGSGDVNAGSGEILSGEIDSGDDFVISDGSGSGEEFDSPATPPYPPAPPFPPPSPPPYWAPAPPDVPFADLVSPDLNLYLKAGDRRMVRPHSSEVTMKRRKTPYTLERVDRVIEELVDRHTEFGVDISLPTQARAQAAEVVTLLVTGDPEMRERLGSKISIFRSLIGLIDKAWREAVAFDSEVSGEATTNNFLAAEAAAEAIWILSYNSPLNHARLLRSNAIEVLGSVVTARD